MKSRFPRMFLKTKPTGFTLIEIVLVVVVITILVAFALASYFKVISKSEDTEALTNLAAIRKAELAKQSSEGTFVNATSTEDINQKLPDTEIQEKIFTYEVVNATVEDFKAIAKRLKPDATKERPIEIAMYADGSVDYAYFSGSGLGGGGSGGSGGGWGGDAGSGGGSSGGSGGGGIGGGSSGGGSGGGGSGGGGSSGGGSGGGGSGGGGSGTGEGTGGGGFGYAFAELPIATGNNGFINLGWTPPSGSPLYYNIYRSSAQGGSSELIVSYWPSYATYYTDSNLTNDQTYYYQVDAVYSDGIIASSGIFSGTPSANSVYAVAASTAFQTLAASFHGQEISEKITLYDVPIGFGSGVQGALAWFSPIFDTITINLDEFSKSQNVHAALLAHEGTHAWWNHDMIQGQPQRGGNRSDSIDQEYRCFVNGANVWNEIKGSETEYNQDGWASVVALGEAQAKEIIRLAYPGLVEY